MDAWEGVADGSDWLLQGRSNREVVIVGMVRYSKGVANVREGVVNGSVADDSEWLSETTDVATEGMATCNVGVVTGNVGRANCRDKLW